MYRSWVTKIIRELVNPQGIVTTLQSPLSTENVCNFLKPSGSL